MTSITGEAYSSLPTAFQYRTSLNPSCTCKPAGGYSTARRRQPRRWHRSRPDGATAAAAARRPARIPETLANRAGDFVPERAGAEDPTPALAADGRRTARRVRSPASAVGRHPRRWAGVLQRAEQGCGWR